MLLKVVLYLFDWRDSQKRIILQHIRLHLLGASAYANDTCSSLVYSEELFVFILRFLTVATPQDNIIESLEAEIIKLKTQLSDTEEKYHKVRKKFDDLMIKMHGGGRK